MDKIKEIINYLFSQKNYMTLAVIAIALVVAYEVSVMFVVPKINTWRSLTSEIVTNTEMLEKLKANKKAQDIEEKKNLIKIDDIPVKIFKSSQPGVPVETVSVDFVSAVIHMLESTNNSILDISYKIDALNDSEKASVPKNVSVVQLTLTINAKYDDFENFVNTLYSYDYLATIKSMKMVPLKENKNVLATDVVLWLYVSK